MFKLKEMFASLLGDNQAEMEQRQRQQEEEGLRRMEELDDEDYNVKIISIKTQQVAILSQEEIEAREKHQRKLDKRGVRVSSFALPSVSILKLGNNTGPQVPVLKPVVQREQNVQLYDKFKKRATEVSLVSRERQEILERISDLFEEKKCGAGLFPFKTGIERTIVQKLQDSSKVVLKDQNGVEKKALVEYVLICIKQERPLGQEVYDQEKQPSIIPSDDVHLGTRKRKTQQTQWKTYALTKEFFNKPDHLEFIKTTYMEQEGFALTVATAEHVLQIELVFGEVDVPLQSIPFEEYLNKIKSAPRQQEDQEARTG